MRRSERSRRPVVPVGGLLALVALLSACSAEEPEFDFPPPSSIVVDSPELRALKAEAGVEPCRPGAEPGVNELPAVTLPCLGGGPAVDLSSLEGPLVLNLWGGWCGPCRAELPILQAFAERHGDRVPMIGIDVRDPRTTAALELIQETGVTYPLLADPDDVLSGKPPFPANLPVPMLVFVREDGSVRPVSAVVEDLPELVGLAEENLGVAL